jgi:hypothetical protein
MSEPTTSLATIRRDICRTLRMPFFQRYSAGYLAATGGSTTSLIDTKLTQEDNFWKQSWVYRIASQEAARIITFTAKDDTARFETPITAVASTDQYEIHSRWNAYEIHSAINEAIRAAARSFPDNTTDETLIVQEDVRSYDLTTLTKAPWVVHRIWLEQPSNVRRGTAVSATATTLIVENSGILSSVTSSWKISIYDGTGKGQIRSVSSVAGSTVNVTAWTTNPDSTSKYALWDASEQTFDWYPYDAVRVSSKEYPSILYFSMRPVDFYGMRIRLEYTALSSELTTEASTTTVPLGYIKPKALSLLHSMKIADTKTDRDLHFGEWKRYQEEADAYMVRNAPHLPDSIFFLNPEHSYQPNADDPLNWGTR